MKILKKNGLQNIGFDKLTINEHFIYADGAFEFFAIKVSKDYAAVSYTHLDVYKRQS